MVSIRTGMLRLLSGCSTPGSETPESVLLVSTRSAMDCGQECVHLCVGFNPDGLFSRDRTGRRSEPDLVVVRPYGSRYIGRQRLVPSSMSLLAVVPPSSPMKTPATERIASLRDQ